MAKYELSAASARDLNEIYIYSYREFGEAKADAYLLSLEGCFEKLAEFPGTARSVDYLRPGYFRFAHASHTVYFVRTGGEFGSFGCCINAWIPSVICDQRKQIG